MYNNISLQASKLVELANRVKKNSYKTKIVTITSGKGGVGKSTITSNLAILLSKKGYKVAVLDADIGLANLQVLFDVKPQNSFFDYIEGKCSLQQTITKTPYENIYLFAGISSFEYSSFKNSFVFSNFVKDILSLDSFDFLLVDTGAGLNDYVKEFLAISDNILAITSTDPSALTDVYALMKMLSLNKRKLMLCFNHTKNYQIGENICNSLITLAKKNSLKSDFMVKYLGNISSCSNIATTSRLRKVFVNEFRNDEISLQMELVLRNLLLNIE
ncbi:polar flagellar biogenesis regulatory protein FlhG [Aliarcobacter faecis]|uniref:P-loop NTPase n=1 Tax=Aliarcobacter faecis TaxID=1564138 RepID=UPI00047A4221|nr:P-loop NTPase [Aliarcobacter faecis]QKF72593.1 polar flagellar biogenesis regulatory protein FlhG [Aliarcobacter faecis]